MRKSPGNDYINFYLPIKLKEDFVQRVPNGDKSDILRGMIMLYLNKPNFRLEVDKFVEVNKTI